MYNPARKIQWSFMIAAAFALLFIVHAAAFAMTPAGTQIYNRAEATYTWQGLTRTTWSEEIAVTVQQVAAVGLSPISTGNPDDAGFEPAYSIAVPAGNWLYIPYKLTNAGNGPDTFHLSALHEAASGVPAPQELFIYHDVNEDGVPSPPDVVVTDLPLAAGETASLLLAVLVPTDAPDGTDYFVCIEAASQTDGSVTTGNSRARLRVENTGGHLFVHRTVSVDPTPRFGAGAEEHGVVVSDGAELTHTLTLTNVSTVRVDDVVLWEPLAEREQLLLDGYGADKAILLNGTPTELQDGTAARLVMNAAGVWGLEIHIPRIQPDHRMQLEYKATIDWGATEGRFEKAGEARYDTVPGSPVTARSNEIVFVSEGTYSLQIGPVGSGMKTPAYYGELVRFPTTVRHTGSLPGTVELGLREEPPTGWEVRFFQGDGVTPLVDTNGNGTVDLGTVQPGSSRQIVVEVRVPADPTLASQPFYEFEVYGSFAEDEAARDSTIVRVEDIQAAEGLWQPLEMYSDQGPAVMPGQEIMFAILFGNDSDVDVYDALLSVAVDAPLTDVQIVHGEMGSTDWIGDGVDADPDALWQALGLTPVVGDFDEASATLRWELPHLAPGVGGKVVFKGTVDVTAAGGTPVDVQGVMTSLSPVDESASNVVRHTVLGNALDIDLAAERRHVEPGDTNTYTATVSNLNPTVDFENVELWISIPQGLTYIPGSSTLDGVPIDDPEIVDGQLRYIIPELPKSGRAGIRFAGLINSLAEGEINVSAQARLQSQPNVWFESRTVTRQAALRQGMFADMGMIVGQVSIDGIGPAGGVRILLDDGRYAVTDADGFFTLRNVTAGPRAVRIDGSSLMELEEIPGGVKSGELRLVRIIVPAAGMAVVNFELQAHVIGVDTEERLQEGKDR